MSAPTLPDWEHLLSAAAHLQQVLPGTTLVGGTAVALADFDRLYPQPSGESALQQLQVQLAHPLPYDLEDTDLTEYRRLHEAWHDWSRVAGVCAGIAARLFEGL